MSVAQASPSVIAGRLDSTALGIESLFCPVSGWLADFWVVLPTADRRWIIDRDFCPCYAAARLAGTASLDFVVLVLLRRNCKYFNVLFSAVRAFRSPSEMFCKVTTNFWISQIFVNFLTFLFVQPVLSEGLSALLSASLPKSECKGRDFLLHHQMFQQKSSII